MAWISEQTDVNTERLWWTWRTIMCRNTQNHQRI